MALPNLFSAERKVSVPSGERRRRDVEQRRVVVQDVEGHRLSGFVRGTGRDVRDEAGDGLEAGILVRDRIRTQRELGASFTATMLRNTRRHVRRVAVVVARNVGEAVGAVVVGIGHVGERAIGIQRERAVEDVVHQVGGQRVRRPGVGVVRQHAGRGRRGEERVLEKPSTPSKN